MDDFMLGLLVFIVALGIKTLNSQLVRLVEQHNDHLTVQKEILEELKKMNQLAKSN
jgi:hypothetical protein